MHLQEDANPTLSLSYLSAHLISEEGSRHIDQFTPYDCHLLSGKNLFGKDRGESSKQMTLSINDVWSRLEERHLEREKEERVEEEEEEEKEEEGEEEGEEGREEGGEEKEGRKDQRLP